MPKFYMHVELLCSVGPTHYGDSSGGDNTVAIGAGSGATGAVIIIVLCAGLIYYWIFCREDEK